MSKLLAIVEKICDMNVIGLPQSEKNRLENIHFLGCSNKVGALSLVEPLVENLLQLERGIEMYDAYLEQNL